jgi:hypothetical protein
MFVAGYLIVCLTLGDPTLEPPFMGFHAHLYEATNLVLCEK